ncbi:hypothetical protein [Iodobacter fluviatilis]|nr:hypothetical protein [Iodobacter fluviatilis]
MGHDKKAVLAREFLDAPVWMVFLTNTIQQNTQAYLPIVAVNFANEVN